MPARAAPPGPWQREYERDWRTYAREAVRAAFGDGAAVAMGRVTRHDERQLREVLDSIDVSRRHHRKRRHSLTEQRGGDNKTRDDSALQDVSYVYRTPEGKQTPPASQASVFPMFTSQELLGGDEATHVAASQRLQDRMAALSPIASRDNLVDDNDDAHSVLSLSPAPSSRRTSIECSHVEPPTKEKAGLASASSRQSRRSSLAALPIHSQEDGETNMNPTAPPVQHLDVSMQSMKLSDDETEHSIEVDDRSTEPAKALECTDTVPNASDGSPPIQGAIGRHHVEEEDDETFMSDDEQHVSKVLTFSSDSEDEASAAKNDNMDCADEDRNPSVLQGDNRTQNDAPEPANANTTERRCSDDAEMNREPEEPEPEYGFSSSPCESSREDINRTSRRSPRQGTADSAVQRSPFSSSSGAGTTRAGNRSRSEREQSSSDHSTSEISDLTQPQPHQRSRRRRRLSTRPQTMITNRVVAGDFLVEQVSEQLLRAKLPLQIQYQFASERKRRKQRRKTLERTPGFPYMRPEYDVELQPYQQEAVKWMLDRERRSSRDNGDEGSEQQNQPRGQRRRVEKLASTIRGGILADEMGLGKTVCCIALICESLRASREACRHEAARVGDRVPRVKAPTLIITPLSILAQWEHELRSRTNLSVVSYQGSVRKSIRTATEFMGADVVLSTYDTLRLKECKASRLGSSSQCDDDGSDEEEKEEQDRDGGGTPAASRSNGSTTPWTLAARLTPRTPSRRRRAPPEVTSKLHQLAWTRVILDESHLITNASCARAQAAFSLKSSRRWCVTGTPIQNSAQDLVSLVQFLGADVTNARDPGTLGELIPRVMLRRLKSAVNAATGTPILALPDKVEEVVSLEFATDVERALYLLLHRSTKHQVLQYLGTRHGNGQFMHVFEQILRLRQTCDACALVTADPRREVVVRQEVVIPQDPTPQFEPLTATESALLQRVRSTNRDDESGGFPRGCEQLSTKVEALLAELRGVKARGDRALVISQWTSFLDLIAARIETHNAAVNRASSGRETLTYDALDGRMARKDRDAVVQRFQRDRSIDVLLLSLRTGGLGLNLTAASHVFIMEPSWNPSLESQAVDRAHRFGQRKRVRVVRFLMKGTIEERVAELQRKKSRLATTLLGDDIGLENERPRLTRDDLRELFAS